MYFEPFEPFEPKGGSGMVKITLTPEQAAHLEPLMQRAYAQGGTVFAQVRRGQYPDHKTATVSCHIIPPESSRRLRTWLIKEAERITNPNQPKNKNALSNRNPKQ